MAYNSPIFKIFGKHITFSSSINAEVRFFMPMLFVWHCIDLDKTLY